MRRITIGRTSICCGVLAALMILTLAPMSAGARGIIWLATKRAASTPVLLHPVMATYRNHAYILSVHELGSSATTSVYFTTNESKSWKTSVLSSQGPNASYSQEFVSLAIDPSRNTLYAAWVYRKDSQHVALGVWTRAGTAAWSGPTDVATGGSIPGQPSIVAGNGHAYVAFSGSPGDYPGSCNDRITHSQDLMVASSTGTTWSSPQNLTSCATDKEAIAFNDPKLAIDEDGKGYVVSRAGAAGGNLWYADTASGSWSKASRLTSGVSIPEFGGSPALRTLYGIAATRGTVYVAYTTGQKGTTVELLVRSAAGTLSGPSQVSPADKAGCPEFGVAVVARAGRILVSYIRTAGGYCTVIGTTNNYNTLHLMTGTPGHLVSINPGLPHAASCGDSTLSSDGDLFRLTANCGTGLMALSGNLYYKKEFLDVVGPNAKLAVSRRAGAGKALLQWTARDPTPGSGVAYFQVEVRSGSGRWQVAAGATRGHSLTYSVQRNHSYTFRLRARDRVNNWGRWVTVAFRG
ncbi:MAG TPA: hypothetical protein VF221_16355 [Chloroflexota bacterium]